MEVKIFIALVVIAVAAVLIPEINSWIDKRKKREG